MKHVDFMQTRAGVAVINRLSPSEEFNRHEYEILEGNLSLGLLPVVYENTKKSSSMSCSVTTLVPLRSHFLGIVSQKTFTDAVSGLIAIVKSCEDAGLDPRNLFLLPEYVFVEPRTKEIRCIFWPLVNNENACDPEEFFRELPYSLVFNKREDCRYVSDYIQYFRTRTSPFSISEFEQSFIGNVSPSQPASAPVANGPEPPSSDPLKRMIERKVGARRNVCSSCSIANAPGAKICVFCGAALIESDEMGTKRKTGTSVLGYSPGSKDLESEESPYPYLIRESTNQIISVDKPRFSIGKDKVRTDFCVADNSAVSRHHAIIQTREDRYFVIDQNSTNKTSIDGRTIPPGEEIEIFPGAKIRLANEEFVFYI